MKLKDKAARIHAELEAHFPTVEIPLDHRDNFTFLCAVMLSAQTTDKKVNQVTPALFDAAPTPAAMAAMPVETIREYIREIGLAPTKAKNLQALSALLVSRHGGEVPASFEAMEALPGVGHKTASVLMSQAFGVPAFPVDTHIHRLAARWGLSDGHSVERTEADLKGLFPHASWNKLHLQVIFFGRAYCPARGHDPEQCPICVWAMPEEVKRAEAFKTPKRAPKKTAGQVPKKVLKKSPGQVSKKAPAGSKVIQPSKKTPGQPPKKTPGQVPRRASSAAKG